MQTNVSKPPRNLAVTIGTVLGVMPFIILIGGMILFAISGCTTSTSAEPSSLYDMSCETITMLGDSPVSWGRRCVNEEGSAMQFTM